MRGTSGGGRGPGRGAWPRTRGSGGAARPAARAAAAGLPLLAGALLAAAPVRAQAGGSPGPFPPPVASPREPATRVAAAVAERAGDARLVALVDFGESLPFWLRRDRGAGWRLAGEVAGGVWSRFDLERTDNEFIETHFRGALRLRAAVSSLGLRLELYHASSHLGDEYLERTGRAPVSTSREGVELLAGVSPAAGLTLYGGPGALLRSSEDLGRGSVRAGATWRSAPAGRPAPFLYVAGEAFAWEERDWEPQVSLEAGLAASRRIRIGVLAGAGPSRAEQFLHEDERLLGLSLTVAF